jgi:hypothetical protein
LDEGKVRSLIPPSRAAWTAGGPPVPDALTSSRWLPGGSLSVRKGWPAALAIVIMPSPGRSMIAIWMVLGRFRQYRVSARVSPACTAPVAAFISRAAIGDFASSSIRLLIAYWAAVLMTVEATA